MIGRENKTMSVVEHVPGGPAGGGAPRPISVMGERVSVAAIFLVYLLLQMNAIHHGSYAGQDFHRNKTIIIEASADPIAALTHLVYVGRGFPTLYHLLGAKLYLLVGKPHYLPALAYFNLGINLIALGAFYGVIRLVLASAVMRVAWLAWTAFLPLFVIPSLVIASDAAPGIFFTLLVWLNILALDRNRSLRSGTLLMSAMAVVLVLMVMIKMNYAMCIVAELIILIVLAAARSLARRQIILGLVLLVLLPLAASATLYKLYLRAQIASSCLENRDQIPPEISRMSLRSFLFFRPTDRELLEAPYFHELKNMGNGFARPLHINNYYSYPGMLPLAMFTDVLNMYQPIVYASDAPGIVDEYYTRVRPPENKLRMQWALKLGLIFYFAGFILIPGMILSLLLRALTVRFEEPDRVLGILAALSSCVVSGMALTLLFVLWPYVKASWLPRFCWPAHLGLFVLVFAALERWVVRKIPNFRWGILAVALVQAALNIAFLWVPGNPTVLPSVEIVDQPVPS